MNSIKKLLIILIFVFVGCSNNIKSSLKENTTEVLLVFYTVDPNDPKMSQNHEIRFENKNEIDILIDSISNTRSPLNKCGYIGSMIFYSENRILLETEFNLYSECKHIVFLYNHFLYSYEISEIGYNYLNEQYQAIPEEQRW